MLTKVEIAVSALIIGLLIAITALIYNLFQQTEVVGALKWGFLLVALSLGSSPRKSS